ncbi:MAG: class I SAM-dependent methyltransferase [Nitrosospira sp.]
MAIYDQYTKRDRFSAGIKIKLHQARRIYDKGIINYKDGPQRILEIGPGDGYIAALTRDAGLSYTGIEGSDAVATYLETEGFAIVRSYVPPLPSGLNGFQVCFMLHIIEHMKGAAEAAQLISQIWDALNDSGILVIACPDYIRWGHYFFDCDYTHSMPFTRRRLRQLLEDHQFEVIEETIYTGPVFGYRGLPLAWLAKLIYPQTVDDIFGRFFKRDSMNRGLLTFLPNLLIVGRKR